jgi:hypothetical protein
LHLASILKLNAVLSAFTGALFSYLRRKAKKSGGEALDAQTYYPGAVTFIQRFGSALNLNVHMHSQVSDGVYVKLGDDRIHFARVAPPSLKETREVTLKIARRVHRYLKWVKKADLEKCQSIIERLVTSSLLH